MNNLSSTNTSKQIPFVKGPLTLDQHGRSVPVGLAPLGPPPTYVIIGCFRSSTEKIKPICAKQNRKCTYCTTSLKIHKKQLVRAAKNQFYAKKSSENAKLRFEDLIHENTFLMICKLNANDDKKAVLDKNYAIREEIRSV